ncbi:MAG: DNA repair protein RecN [Lachnospiraceae bacterium]|nr:DNA repair protein RecN [Lachnospiraceae bacterium]
MLKNLHVKNLALIEEAEVTFNEGLNILSGETGAGKSIIIDSINLALGEKVPYEMVRDEDKAALVELIFSVENDYQRHALEELMIEPEDDCVILSRKILNKRAVARINSETVTAKELKQVASVFIDIYGQQEHQTLLDKRKHLVLLDSFLGDDIASEKAKMKELYDKYHILEKELKESEIDEVSRNREMDLLRYEISEIEAADIKDNEDNEVEERYRIMSGAARVAKAVSVSRDAFFGEGMSVSECVGRAIREFTPVSDFDDEAAEIYKQMNDAEDILNGLSHSLNSYLDSLEFSDEEFYEVESRLNVINNLKGKYGNTVDDIKKALEDRRAKLQKYEDFDFYREELLQKYEFAKKEMLAQCEVVSGIRKKGAAALTFKVTQSLIDLNFLDVKFDMRFEEVSPSENGFDSPEFMISVNPGEPLKQLTQVASGGELSRIMLALKSVLAENDKVGTLIFDEIDTGISGRTAQMVSSKMNEISDSTQIIAITHLPQIASMADSHYLIEKSVDNNVTLSSIRLLDHEGSIEELARMLGGVMVTDAVLENAREMKRLAENEKRK